MNALEEEEMKSYFKKAVVCAAAAALAVGSMTGCSKNVDGSKTVSTVNDEEIKLINYVVDTFEN